MNAVSKESYRGVLCMSCRKPIPVPGILVSLDRVNETTDRQERVFSLRCRCCNREKPYRTSEIVEFEGAPLLRASRPLHPQVAGRQSPLRARAANG
jgi:hypothetical protein